MKQKPSHDLAVRLGNKKALKDKLRKIAGKNNISLNQLLIFLIEWFISSYEKGEKFKTDLK